MQTAVSVSVSVTDLACQRFELHPNIHTQGVHLVLLPVLTPHVITGTPETVSFKTDEKYINFARGGVLEYIYGGSYVRSCCTRLAL